jgi:hypothetical protein
MAIAPVKKGSHTFRECIPGHRSRQLFNYQRDIFLTGRASSVTGSSDPLPPLGPTTDLYRGIPETKHVFDPATNHYLNWETVTETEIMDPNPVQFLHTLRATCEWEIDVSDTAECAVDLRVYGKLLPVTYENIGADGTCVVTMSFSGGTLDFFSNCLIGFTDIYWETPAGVTGEVHFSGDGSSVWVNGINSRQRTHGKSNFHVLGRLRCSSEPVRQLKRTSILVYFSDLSTRQR